MTQNAIPATAGVADRVAQQTLAKRGATYAEEVRRLLDAGMEVMRARGTSARPRVADIVSAAGLSNDAFYRHFPSKDALVAAIVQDGAERLRSYIAHQMGKEPTPDGKVRRWVAGVLSQAADDDIAHTTRSVLWNGSSVGDGSAGPSGASSQLASLLHEPFAALGSTDPVLDASLVGHAVVGKMSEYLWQPHRPTPAEIDHIVDFCLRALTR